MKKIVSILIVLIIITGIVGYLYWERMTFSKGDVRLEILGPREVVVAEEVEFVVRYQNIGHIRLDEPELVFELPDNVLLGEGLSLRQKLGQGELGIAIYPGEERTFRFRARFLGAEGDNLTIRAGLSYRPKGLNVRFESETTFMVTIKSVPISLNFDFPPEVEAGRDFEFQINYFSNIDYPLLGLRIMADYPVNFTFIEASPRALEQREWDLPPLNMAEGGRITITGRIDGQPGDQKVFRASLGMWRDGRLITLKRINRGIALAEPELQIIQQINYRQNHVVTPGEHLYYEILFKNIGNETLTGLNLTVNLFGEAFDLGTLSAPEGTITAPNAITWNWRHVGDLQFLKPQEEGRVEFWIQTKEDWDIGNLESGATLKSVVFLGPVRQEFITKINSKLEVSQVAYFQDDVFGNSGPLPPQVGLTTTYTVTWQVKNNFNRVRDVEVRAVLAENVRLTGKIFPEEMRQDFTFDSISREIIWRVGELEVGQGILNPAPNISFQIAFTPTEEQRRHSPTLIGVVRATGQDTWTEQVLSAHGSIITTVLPNDPL